MAELDDAALGKAVGTIDMLADQPRQADSGSAEDRGAIIGLISATVRAIEAVEWITGHLADEAVTQTTCRGLVEFAHHRSLRQTNSERFDEIVDHGAAVASGPALADRARRYKAGL